MQIDTMVVDYRSWGDKLPAWLLKQEVLTILMSTKRSVRFFLSWLNPSKIDFAAGLADVRCKMLLSSNGFKSFL
jgi:hypothetical protein